MYRHLRSEYQTISGRCTVQGCTVDVSSVSSSGLDVRDGYTLFRPCRHLNIVCWLCVPNALCTLWKTVRTEALPPKIWMCKFFICHTPRLLEASAGAITSRYQVIKIAARYGSCIPQARSFWTLVSQTGGFNVTMGFR